MRPIAAVLASLLLLGSTGLPAAASSGETPGIVVQGTGEVDRAPDQAVVTFTIQTSDDRAQTAVSKNNAVFAALSQRLAGLGLAAPKAVRTTSFGVSFNPRPQRPNPEYGQIYGYVVNRSVSVTDDRTDRAGQIVDAAVGAGVTQVGGIAFGLRDPRAAYRAALAVAVADARAQAEALAAAAGVRLGAIITISPAGASVPRPVGVMMARTMAAQADVPTDVQPSDLTVRASVGVSYAIAR